MSDCNHTPEEHTEDAGKFVAQIIQAAVTGDYRPLLVEMGPDEITLMLQSIMEVVFVRLPTDEAFANFLNLLRDETSAVMLGDQMPEVREKMIEVRRLSQQKDESVDFKAEAEEDLRIMFEQQGVIDNTPKAATDDSWPGQYL